MLPKSGSGGSEPNSSRILGGCMSGGCSSAWRCPSGVAAHAACSGWLKR